MRLVKLTAVALLGCSLPATAQAPDFSKVQIKAEVVAPGVAVLYGAGGNIGLSYGEDGSVLIDDQFAPLTDKIVAAVAGLGAKPVKYLVNTHWHFDHTGGNENLGKAGVTIFAHENVRVRMLTGATAGVAAVPPATEPLSARLSFTKRLVEVLPQPRLSPASTLSEGMVREALSRVGPESPSSR